MSITKSAFIQDRRHDNPGLHMLYVKTAVGHLRLIDKAIKSFQNTSNINMHDSAEALHRERAKLIAENAAYADADEILYVVKHARLPEPKFNDKVLVGPVETQSEIGVRHDRD